MNGGHVRSGSAAVGDSARLWATKWFGRVAVEDARLRSRLILSGALLVSHPGVSVLQACGSWKASKGLYRLWSNPRLPVEAIREGVQEVTASSCEGLERILLIQDSTCLSFTAKERIQGLGLTNDHVKSRGLWMHWALALRENGTLLGVLDQQVWARAATQKGKAKQRRQRPFEEKESFKWVRGMRGARRLLEQELEGSPRPRVLHLQDREGDIFEVLTDIVQAGEEAVIRCAQNRCAVDAQEREVGAHQAVRQSPLLGRKVLEIPRSSKHPARQARVQLRAVRLKVQPPKHRSAQERGQPLELSLVEVWEANPPAGAERVHWMLWTTQRVETLKQAWQMVQTDMYRWSIEEVHLILKSAFRVEHLQLESVDRIQKALAMYLPMAVRLCSLKKLAVHEPQAPCTRVLSDEEWQTLWLLTHRRVPTAQTPVPTIRQVSQWIGQLGGHLGRKGDGVPGVRTLWKGWRDLLLMTYAIRAHKQVLRH